MHKKFTKGFTLIELLVVIAIIGILASIVLVSLNSARSKGRDAKRVSELQQMARVVAIADTGSAVAFGGCDQQDDLTTACTGAVAGLASFFEAGNPAACTSASTAVCGYSVSDTAGTGAGTTGDWRVRSYLEVGAGSLSQGRTCISSGTSTPYQGSGC
ncbi:MAG: type II secretion system protein [Candidatus Pacebacteria bacterium]|nr:type II secretion system protein [Candidatus Paceibacterota bacterium]